MPRIRWVAAAVIGAAICGSGIVLASPSGPGNEPFATTGTPRPASIPSMQLSQAAPQARQPAPSSAPPVRPAPEAPRRVETTQYKSWVVTCQESVGGSAKRNCLANLRLVNQDQATVLNWEIGPDPQGHFVTAIHTASALAVKNGDQVVVGPISIPYGIELRFGNGTVRRLSFATCGPQQCVAEGVIDDAFLKEATANTKATITVHTPNGALPFEIAINGIDKAITNTR